jgi:ABC-2 type transport system permease protein
MIPFFTGLRVIVGLELAQRVRGVAVYVLLGLFALLLGVTTALVWVVGASDGSGGYLYSIIVYFVLLLGTLIAPALSGAAVNGDRDAGTLATTQVTLVSTTQIVLGKFVASWVTSLAFLAVALPFLLASFALGGLSARTVVSSVLVLLAELAVVSAIGVGLSAILTRPLFSVAATYLVVAALSIGTLIAFGLGGAAIQTPVRSTYIGLDYGMAPQEGSGDEPVCLPPQTTTSVVPRFDLVWGFLAANPYVVLADASAGTFTADGYSTSLFGDVAVGVRGAQSAPETETVYDECALYAGGESMNDTPTPEEIYRGATPSWFVGLLTHVVIGGGLLAGGIARTRTPATRLPGGQRIA